ncbi:hypothetical protein [Roseobacter sp.]|uniref:hypothetical protein n=1 Tax=Roseobacter sp. TaxID=1907202 RepID=UPI0029664F5D|nr:hypothetical protein [Roseobacter sp.]MDW3181763.1 hypothetical protein [Roseobacter sp.]
MSWLDPLLYSDTDDLVIVLCRVTEPQISEFPRACELPVSSGDHAVGDLFTSIGFKLAMPEDLDNEWSIAGWNMTQDCWEDARCFEVIGWRPLAKADVSQ